MKRLLFVEDDADYSKAITKVLTKEGYAVTAAPGPIEAMEIFTKDREFDLVISDLAMTPLDGIQFLTYIKNVDPTIKTMIMTAAPTLGSELAALDVYVDRYMEKDTHIELILRYIERLLEAPPKKAEVLASHADNVIVNLLSFKVTKNDEEIPLTPKEYGVLKMLLERKGQAISREEILDELWDNEFEVVETRVVDVHIKSIRRKLQVQSIVSIRGYGYKWDE